MKFRGALRVLAAVLLLAAGGCGYSRSRTPSIGEAFVAPMSLQVRADLGPRAAVAATVRHGERLEVLGYRRRFANVRTSDGVEGWTDGRQILPAKAMRALERAHEQGRPLPSQGRVIAFDLLNVHIAPNRLSPSFYQLSEDAAAELIERKVTPRIPYDPEGREDQPVPEGTLKDDWSRVRLPDGRSGWVLARMTMMDLPDEITQYANGDRITGAFPLGAVRGEDGASHETWLWMTKTSPPEGYQFDAVRLFVWNPAKHRYETRYSERGIKGYYPVTRDISEDGCPRIRTITAGETGLVERTFVFRDRRFELVSTAGWTPPALPRSGGEVTLNRRESGSPLEWIRRWLGGVSSEKTQ
jgi:SH3-like domain-containing protein